jgi:hypothetical protein
MLALFLMLLAVSNAFAFNMDLCHDHRGRPGAWKPFDDCHDARCSLVASFRCTVPDLPPRLVAGGLWECNEGYKLMGARFSWPGGVFAAEPEACKPV